MSDSKWISGLTPATPVGEAGRRVLQARLDLAGHFLERALHAPYEDVEFVHQLRVGTRRAVAAVEIFVLSLPSKVYRRARRRLRQLRRAAGRARDWDVFLLTLQQRNRRSKILEAESGFLTGYALGQRHAAQTQLEQAHADLRLEYSEFARQTVAAVRDPVGTDGPQHLDDLGRPLLAGLAHELDEAAAKDVTDYQNLHRVRIQGKRLRYAMEVFVSCFPPAFRQELYPTVEEMQDILGRANDSHVACQHLVHLRNFLEARGPAERERVSPAIQGLLRYHQRRLPQERRRFMQWWQHWQQEARRTFATLVDVK